MCGIAGFSNFNQNFKEEPSKWYSILQQMNRSQKHRGPDEDNVWLSRKCGLSHVRLSILDLAGGKQPMSGQLGDHRCTIVYNGEIYNMNALRQELAAEGASFQTTCDTEVILMGYLLHGWEYVKQLNGIFAFAIWDDSLETLLLFRDRLGVKPLFYSHCQGTFLFASEMKGLFAYPQMTPAVTREGLCEIFGLGPAKTYGKGVFEGIDELLPGYCLSFKGARAQIWCYWSLQSQPHTDSFAETVEKTRFLITDAVKLQMLSDVPICTFLSGGVDSSLVTSICSRDLQKQGKILDTYSFDFQDNASYFQANAFQPSQDRPWVDAMTEYCQTNHHYLECNNTELYDYLFRAVDARDLPCMADVESSMLYFCSQVAPYNKVTLTGECADEIFGGYPWFHKVESLNADCFPWAKDFTARTALLKDEVLRLLPLEEYARAAYRRTILETPALEGEKGEEKRRREISYLNQKWFMQTLLDRMDRTSMHSGLEARVPFADHRLVEYVWNVPWEMKCPGGMVKGLLREAGRGYLPDAVLFRKKSPYPKTYDPAYEELLKQKLTETLSDSHAPICDFIDKKKLADYCSSPSDYGRPFYGQLMAGPQLLAYLLQVNYWLEHYHVSVKWD